MLRFFQPITVSEAMQQHDRLLQESASIDAAARVAASRAAAERPGPGRPKKQLDASKILSSAAVLASAGAEHKVNNDSAELPSSNKRGKYNNWSVSVPPAQLIWNM